LLVRDSDEMEKEKTLSMKKGQAGGGHATIDKMDKLRKELHTDDDGKWAFAMRLQYDALR